MTQHLWRYNNILFKHVFAMCASYYGLEINVKGQDLISGYLFFFFNYPCITWKLMLNTEMDSPCYSNY